MLEVKFYDLGSVPDENLKFAVIVASSRNKLVFCKHSLRQTFEIPGGHRETGETIDFTASRELKEETGALEFDIEPVCVYSVTGKNRLSTTGEETFGMLYYADIKSFEPNLEHEISEIIITDKLPIKWTYPLIQPKLLDKVLAIKPNIKLKQLTKSVALPVSHNSVEI